MSLDTPPHHATTTPALDALRRAAIINVALHAVGLVFAAVTMRPGTPAAALSARMAYLGARPPGWIAGWLTWIACAAALAAFLVLLARAVPSPWTRAGAVIAAGGAIVDVACDLVYAWILPARAMEGAAAFVLFEHHLGVASLTVANGLYSAAILLATLALPRAALAARALGVLTFVGGLVLAGAGLSGDPRHILVGTAITIPCFMGWTLAVSSTRRR